MDHKTKLPKKTAQGRRNPGENANKKVPKKNGGLFLAQNKIDIRRETGQNFGIKVPNRNHRFFRQYYRGPGDEKT